MQVKRESVSLGDLIVSLGFRVCEDSVAVTGLCLDSREVKAGDVFVALQGEHSDGRDYINQALAAGAVAVFAEGEVNHEEYPVYYIAKLKTKLGVLASLFNGAPSSGMGVVGITGTNGKTTCAQLIKQGFEILGEKSATIGTMGYGVKLDNLVDTGLTTPDAISCQTILKQFREKGVAQVSMEVSSHAIDQGRCEGIQFSGGVFTNLSQDHLDYHRTMEDYAQTKAKLFESENRKFAVVNIDDRYGRDLMLSRIPPSVLIVVYGMERKSLSGLDAGVKYIFGDNIHYSREGIKLDIESSWGRERAECSLLGNFNAYNVLATMAVLCASGYAISDVAQTIKKFKPVAGRMELLSRCGADVSVCIDYAHTPDALEKAIVAAKEHTAGKVVTVFGCGGDRDKTKRPIMGSVAEKYSGRVVVTSDNPRNEDPAMIIEDVLKGIDRPVEVKSDRAEAIEFAIESAERGDLVLVAGKGHESYQIVGNKKYPFSDVDVALRCLDVRKKRLAGGCL